MAIFLLTLSVIAIQILGTVFLLAGAGKLLNARQTRQGLAAYALIPESTVGVVATSLAWIEFTLACCLITGIGGGIAPACALVLLAIFSMAQVIVLLRGQEVPCGCFGSLASRPIRWTNILVNLGLGACCPLAAVAYPNIYSFEWIGFALSSGSGFFTNPTEVVVVQLITTIGFIQFLGLKQILDNHAQQQSYVCYLRESAAAVAIRKLGSHSEAKRGSQ
jgi:Methylamine utilisation protein MauE